MATQSLCLEMVLLSIPAILSEGTIASTSFQNFATLLEELFASDVLVCIGSHWMAKLQACSGIQRDLAYQVLSLLEDRVEILEVPEALAVAFWHLPLTKSIDVAIAQENGIDLQIVWQHHGAIDLEDLTITDMSDGGASIISANQFMQAHLKFNPESSQEAIDGGLSEIRAWMNPFLPGGSRLLQDPRSLQANLTYHNLLQQAHGDPWLDTSSQSLFTLGLSFFFLEVRTLESFTAHHSAISTQNPVVTVLEINTQAIAASIVSNVPSSQTSIHETDEVLTSEGQPRQFIKPLVISFSRGAFLLDPENSASENTPLESTPIVAALQDASPPSSPRSNQADSPQDLALSPPKLTPPSFFPEPITLVPEPDTRRSHPDVGIDKPPPILQNPPPASPAIPRLPLDPPPRPVPSLPLSPELAPAPMIDRLMPARPWTEISADSPVSIDRGENLIKLSGDRGSLCLSGGINFVDTSGGTYSISDLGGENTFILRSGDGMLQIQPSTTFNSQSRFGLIAGINFEDLVITEHIAQDPLNRFTEIRLAQTGDVLAQISTVEPIGRELFVTVLESPRPVPAPIVPVPAPTNIPAPVPLQNIPAPAPIIPAPTTAPASAPLQNVPAPVPIVPVPISNTPDLAPIACGSTSFQFHSPLPTPYSPFPTPPVPRSPNPAPLLVTSAAPMPTLFSC